METPTNRLGKQDSAAKRLSEITIGEELRTSTGSVEFDRVLGGGLIRGALILVGGDPGIGKSTLLLQAMGHLADEGERVLYTASLRSITTPTRFINHLCVCLVRGKPTNAAAPPRRRYHA